MDPLPEGFLIGHREDRTALTGCTVVLCPPSTVGGCDIRGSSPGSRELALLASERTMQEVHAVLLTGGSAFGLAAADGVMRYLEERSTGYRTPWGRVPIVPAAVIFDLNIGSSTIRPRPDDGYAACEAAARSARQGNAGAGMGATVGKWGGDRMKGGFGMATLVREDVVVTAAAVVNAIGDVIDAQGDILAGARGPDGEWLALSDPLRTLTVPRQSPPLNTTLVVVMTNARLTKVEANRVAQRGHDGMARAVIPSHTSYDGDLVITLASGAVPVPAFDLIAEMAAAATSAAIRNGVLRAASAGGVTGLSGDASASP